LQLLVAVIDAELFKTVVIEDFEAIDIQDSDERALEVVVVNCIVHLDHLIDLLYNPQKQSLVHRLRDKQFVLKYPTSVVRFRDSVKFKRVKLLTVKVNIMLSPTSRMLSSRAIQNIPDMLGYL